MLDKKDILSYYIDSEKNLYQMIGYCDSPTVIMQNVHTRQTDHVVPDCLNAEKFIKLIPEKESEQE